MSQALRIALQSTVPFQCLIMRIMNLHLRMIFGIFFTQVNVMLLNSMEHLFKFHGENIHYEILVSFATHRIVKLHQELVRSDEVLYLRVEKFLAALIIAQIDFKFSVVIDKSDLPF